MLLVKVTFHCGDSEYHPYSTLVVDVLTQLSKKQFTKHIRKELEYAWVFGFTKMEMVEDADWEEISDDVVVKECNFGDKRTEPPKYGKQFEYVANVLDLARNSVNVMKKPLIDKIIATLKFIDLSNVKPETIACTIRYGGGFAQWSDK